MTATAKILDGVDPMYILVFAGWVVVTVCIGRYIYHNNMPSLPCNYFAVETLSIVGHGDEENRFYDDNFKEKKVEFLFVVVLLAVE